MKEKFLEIINHWGVRKQLKHFNSEVFELNESIFDYENDKYYMKSSKEELAIAKEHIAEEIGDCMLMLMQFQEYYKISNNDILNVIDFKLKRTLNKIDEEKNGN